MKIVSWTILALFLTVWSGCSAEEVLPAFDVAYGPEPHQKLDFCKAVKTERPTAAVLLIHGGGWTGGKKEDLRLLCRLFASKGVSAATVEYRLADGSARGAWPAQVKDVALAMDWLTRHAATYDINPAKICLLGHSAGAQIVLVLAANLIEAARNGSLLRPACLVDNWGPTDLNFPAYRGALRMLFPRSYDEFDKDIASMSPLDAIGRDFPPVFIAQGTSDYIVPRRQSEILAEKLELNEVHYEILHFAGGHEMAGLSPEEKDAIFYREIDFVSKTTSRLRKTSK